MTKVRVSEINTSPTNSIRDEQSFAVIVTDCHVDLSQFGFEQVFKGYWMHKFDKSANGLKQCNELMPKVMQPDYIFDGMVLDKDTLLKLKS